MALDHASDLTRRSLFLAGLGAMAQASGPRPNILWITCEDTGPHLGSYGDRYADTPNLDRLAARGLRYLHAWSNAPVCAPARTAIISGLYPTSTGAEHMRSITRLAPGHRMYPCYLREAGYHCTNNSKEDYNLHETGTVWDESSPKAHWRSRKPGQPFFAIFNFVTTHESQIRRRPHTAVHDPAGVRVPAYHPDEPEVRRDWAQYYDNITTMDRQAGEVLRQLEQDGLAEDTIVLFYGDHGSGMPRSKRWPYNSGLQVPLLAHFPPKFRHLAPPGYREGGTTDRLVSFVDLAPTVLSVAGVRPPSHLQGHAFAGQHIAPPQPFLHGFRGRMDERYDLVRTVTDGRYVYVRNYMPHKIYGQRIAYMFETPTTQVWRKRYDENRLSDAQRRFWEPKPAEELYDLTTDRDEVRNLAQSPDHRPTLQRLRQAQQRHASRIRDIGFLPEDEIHRRAADGAPYEVAQDARRYPFDKVLAAAERAASLTPEATPKLAAGLTDPEAAVRYWSVLGLHMRSAPAVSRALVPLRGCLDDAAPSVRIASADALARYGGKDDLHLVLPVLLSLADPVRNGTLVSMQALNAVEAMGTKAAPLRDRLKALPTDDPNTPQRFRSYVPRLLESVMATLG